MGLSVRDEKSGLENGPRNPFEDAPADKDRALDTAAMTVPAAAGPRQAGVGTLAQDLIITAFGAMTSILTALVLFLIEQTFEVSVYAWIWCFVFPVGALLAGFAASGGYYFGAWYFDYRPTRQILLNMVGVSVGTFFLVHWLGYRFMQVGGNLISEQISFFPYLDFLFRHQSVQFSWGPTDLGVTGELGAWGYLYALLQIAGFALGGVCIFRRLALIPYCEKCSRYFSAWGKQERFTDDPYVFASTLKEVAAAFDSGRLQDAIERHTVSEGSKSSRKCRFRSSLDLRCCSGCGMHRLGFSAHERVGNYWKDIKGAKLAGLREEALRLPK